MDALNVLLLYIEKMEHWNLHCNIVEIVSKPAENHLLLVFKIKEKTCSMLFSDVREHFYNYRITLSTGYEGYINLKDDGSSMYSLAKLISK